MKNFLVSLTLAVLCAQPIYAQRPKNGSLYFVPGTTVAFEVTNDNATGTTLHKLAKLTGATSTAIITAAGDTQNIEGVVVYGAGTSGRAAIAKAGQALLTFDGGTTAGDYVQHSASAMGEGTDAGASCPSSGQVLGRVLTTNTGAGTYYISVGSSCPGGSAGSGMVYPTGTGIVEVTGGAAWGSVYNAGNTVPNNYLGTFTSGSNGLGTGAFATIASYVLATTTVNGHALSSNVTVTNSDLGAVPTSTTVNGHALSSNVTVTNSDLGAVPTSTTVNGHALSSNVTVSASDLTTGTLPHAQLPALVSGDIPNNAANTSGTAATATSATSASSVPFSGVGAAQNNNALVIGSGGSIHATGTGINDANYLLGSALPFLSNGNLCYLGTWGICPPGTGTLTNTGGPLATNAIVLGVTANDTKTSTGITTDGASGLTLGVVGGANGALNFKGLTSGNCQTTVAATAGTLNLCGNVTVTPAGVIAATGFTGPLTGTASDSAGAQGHAWPALSGVGFLNWTGAAWALSSAGTGSVTNLTVGDAAPLFTSNVANPTSTPAVTYTLSNAAAHTLLGNATASPAAPTYGYTVGTSASNIPQLDGSAHLPAVDGSNLTGLTNTQISGLGTFATQNYATPPAIGGSTPAAGAFTNLAASGTVSGTGFSTYLASPPAIGGTAPAAGAFTTLSATGAISATSDGVHAGIVSLLGNTTNPSIPANSFGWIAPSSASFTSYFFKCPSTGPAASSVMLLGAVSSGISACTFTGISGSGNLAAVTSPTFVTPTLGAASATSLSVTGQITSTLATGTAPLVIASTTPVSNLSIGGNAATATTATTASNFVGCTPSTAGSACIWNGSAWTLLAGNTTSTKVLQETSAGVASWANPGTGTVTSVGTGTGLTGGPITTSGTLSVVSPLPLTEFDVNGATSGHCALTASATLGTLNICSTSATVDASGNATFLTLNGVTPANLVTSTSPGVGICHFAGSTQNCTSSQIVTADIAANAVTASQVNGSICAPVPFTGLTDGSTVTWAIGSVVCANASLTFTAHSGSRTLNLTGVLNGGSYVLKLKQDGTGGESLTGGTGCTWKQAGGGGGTFTLTSSPNAIDVVTFTIDESGNCLAVLKLGWS